MIRPFQITLIPNAVLFDPFFEADLMQSVQSQQARHILQGLAAFVIVVTGIKLGNTLVMPLLLSAFLTLLANPLVNLLERCRFPRSIAIVFTLTAFVIIMLTFVVAASLIQFKSSLSCTARLSTTNDRCI